MVIGIVYHHWHGTHTNEPDRIKDFPNIDLEAEKQKVFKAWQDIPDNMPLEA